MKHLQELFFGPSRRGALMLAVFALVAASFPRLAAGERIKDIASIQGVRPNQLMGYGLVVGLDGSGDQTTQTPFTVQSMQAMLAQLGITLPPGLNIQLKNAAAVMVTAMLPAFAKPGQLLDVTVSSLGNAKSLRGGTLLLTPLKGADGRIYAMSQGNVVIAGAGASAAGSKVQINQLNSGRIPGGATVEQAVLSPLHQGDTIDLELHANDFGTARRVAEAINTNLGPRLASAMDARVVRVRAPQEPNERIAFVSHLEELTVEAPRPPAKVIINARTGSIVMNSAVTLEPSAVAHGNLSVTITTTPLVSQPGILSSGQTVVSEKADIQIKQEAGNVLLMERSAQLADVVRALNLLGATPQDLLSILQAMKAAGALRAELEVI